MTFKWDFILAYPQIICFDGEEDGDALGDAVDSGDDGQQETKKQETVFTQEQVNKFLAEDRRKREQKLKSQEEQVKKAEERLQQIASQAETTKEQKVMLEMEIEQLRASRRSEEEQRKHLEEQRKKAHENEINDLKSKMVEWEGLYKSSTIERALNDAAIAHEAFRPGQIVDLLRNRTEMKEAKDKDGNVILGQYVPMVAVQVTEEDGTVLTNWVEPNKAVELMKNDPDRDGNLFKNSVIAGIGGGTAPSTGSNSAKVDPNKLSDEEFERRFREDPKSLGLRPKTYY